MFVGFKRATIGIYDDYGNIIKTQVIDGKEDKGATVTAEINGLSSEPIKTYSPSTAFNLLVVGTDDVTVNLSVIDMPVDFESAILGYNKKTNLFYGGETTSPPYISLLLESSDIRGDKVFLGFFRGKTVLNDLSMRTETAENEELEATTYTMYFESNENNDTYIKGIGENAEDELKDLLFPGAFPSRPYNLQASNIGYSNFDLSWEHSTSKKFNVYLNGRLHTTTPYKTITIDGLTENTSYSVSVTAVGSAGESDPTKEIKVKTKEYITPVPENVKIENIAYTSATLTFAHSDADKFRILLDDSFYSETINQSVKISDLKPSKDYELSVQAFKHGKWSEKTLPVKFKTKDLPKIEILKTIETPTKIIMSVNSHNLPYKIYLDNEEKTSTIFEELKPDKTYTVKLAPYLNDYVGQATVTDVKTKPIPQISNLVVKDVTMHTAIVSFNGESQQYKIFLNNELIKTVDIPIYKLEGLKKNTDYTVKIVGVYDNYESEPVEASFKTPNLPVPHSLKITNITYKGATLSWLGNSDSYKVYVYDVLYKETENNTLDLELEPNTEYVAKVSGVYESEEGEKSESITLTTKEVPAITDLKVLAAGTNYLEFGWAGETGKYEVTFDDKVITQAKATYKAAGLEQGQTYSIKVRSVYNNSYSEYVELSAKTSTIATPTNVAVSDITYKTAKVSWTGDFEEYNVYLNDSLIQKVASKAFVFEDLKPNEKYNVSIQSVKGNDTSEKTTPIQFTTSNVPVVTDLKVASVGYDFIEISWNGLDSYMLDVNGEQIKTTDNVYRKAGLKQSETVTFKVANVYQDVASDYSTVQATTNKVAEVTGLQVTDKSYKSISLKWSTSYKKVVVHYNDNKTETVNNTIKLDDLIPQKEYTVSVVAVDEDFESEKVSVVATTDIVPVPKFTLDSSNNEITVKITETPTGKVEIWLDENSKNITSNSVHKFTNLESGKEYTVNLSSVYKDYRSVVVSQKIKTKTAVPPEINVAKVGISYVDFEIIGTQNDYRIVVDGVTDYLTTDKSHRITELNANTSYTIKAYQRFDDIWSEHVSETVKTGEMTEDSYIIDIYPDSFEKEHEWFNSMMLDVAQGKKVGGISTSGVPKKPEITSVEELTVHDFSLVTKIEIVNEANLTGEIPSTIGNLSNLKYLYLYNNNLTGEMPNSVGNLSNSHALHLYNNNLTGEIPSTIGNLSNSDLRNNNLNAKGGKTFATAGNFNSSSAKKITIPGTQPILNSRYKLSELVDIPLENSAKLEEIAGLPVTVEINGVKYLDRKLRYEDPLITGIPTDQEQNFRIWVYDGDVVKNGMYIEYSISNNLRMSRMATLPPVNEVIKDMPASLNEQQRKTYITSKLAEYQTNNNNIQE